MLNYQQRTWPQPQEISNILGTPLPTIFFFLFILSQEDIFLNLGIKQNTFLSRHIEQVPTMGKSSVQILRLIYAGISASHIELTLQVS